MANNYDNWTSKSLIWTKPKTQKREDLFDEKQNERIYTCGTKMSNGSVHRQSSDSQRKKQRKKGRQVATEK